MKINKLFILCCAACCATFLYTSTTFAADAQITTTTGTIADGGSGPGIQVKLSPGVSLGYALNSTAGEEGSSFAINTNNTNVKFDTGTGTPIQIRNEYAIASDYPGYYMRPVVAATLAAPSADDSAAFPTTGTGAYTKQ